MTKQWNGLLVYDKEGSKEMLPTLKCMKKQVKS